MKTLLISSIFFLLYSCNSTPQAKNESVPIGRQWNIKLENQLGEVTVVLPNHFDTLLSWTQTSDCGDGCSYVDYRVQPHKLPVFKESGFMYFPLKDSVEQFTIKHSKLNYIWQAHESLLKRYQTERLKGEANKYPSGKYIIDTVVTIDNRYFPIIGYITYDSTDKTTTQYLSASTALKENLLQFFFEYRKNILDSSSKNFIENSFQYLKTIKINNGR